MKPENLAKAAAESKNCYGGLRNPMLRIRMQPGYDHSYYFISSFMREHVHFHARALTE